MIDTLKYTRELESAGLTRDQAEMFVRSQIQMITDNVITKNEFLSEISQLKAELNQLEARTTLEIQKMVNRLGILVVSSISALGVFQGVLFWVTTK